MRLNTISNREASIFACLIDTVVEPVPPLPPVAQTDAVAFFDRWMERSPAQLRLAFRALVHFAEVAPLLVGFRHRLRRLPAPERLRYIQRLERAPLPPIRQVAMLVNGMATLAYYGDDEVMRMLGYDADASVARGRELRAREGRP
jgi:hypothetical protein